MFSSFLLTLMHVLLLKEVIDLLLCESRPFYCVCVFTFTYSARGDIQNLQGKHNYLAWHIWKRSYNVFKVNSGTSSNNHLYMSAFLYVIKVAIVENFNCVIFNEYMQFSPRTDFAPKIITEG